MIARGVAYRKTKQTNLCWSATVETGVLFIGRGLAYRKTVLHEILFISTVDPLQPPRATVHPSSTSSSLHLRLFIHGLLFIQPPPRATPLGTIQPALSTGSFSTTPPRATIHPALHHLLFIQPSTPRGPIHPAVHGHPSTVYCSSSPPHHGVPFIQRQRHRSLFIQPPNNAHCSSREGGSRFDRLQLAVVAKESLDHSGSVTRSLQCNRWGSVMRCLARIQLERNASHPRACV